ncbi:MAG: RNA polymerase sigma factor [Phycisphaerales bacterium]|nr:RNA polymerase sigma factor [Phycisphaerales bacterium]
MPHRHFHATRSARRNPSPTIPSEEKRRQLESEALPLMDQIFTMARRMVGEKTQAEELVQETYLRAFRSADQYRLGSNIKAWLSAILRSVHIDSYRYVQASSRNGTHEELTPDIFANPERTDLAIDPTEFMSVLDMMVDDDIREAILQLPDIYREAFVMVVVSELTYEEAADRLGVQIGTVKSRVFRACQDLKIRLWRYAVERRMAPPVRYNSVKFMEPSCHSKSKSN